MPRIAVTGLPLDLAARLDDLVRVLGSGTKAVAFLLESAPETPVEVVRRDVTLKAETLERFDAAAERAGLTRASLLRFLLEKGADP